MPFIPIEGGSLYYEIHGKGDPVVFIPGLGGDHRTYINQLEAHAALFQCVLFDNRLTGQSQMKGYEVHPRNYTFELLASDIKSILDFLHIEKAHIIGASLGGIIAQFFTLAYPERVASLSLHSTWAKTTELLKLKLQSQIDLLNSIELPLLMRSLGPWIWSEETLTERKPLIESYRNMMAEGDPPVIKRIYLLQAKACFKLDISQKIGAIQTPTLISAGEDDLLIPRRDSELIHQTIKGSVFHVFPGCGHGPSLEKPEEFSTVSIDFLQKNRR